MKQVEEFKAGIKKLGVEKLNEIQEKCIEKSLKKDSLILYAPTGSGKTLAFSLNSLLKLNSDQKSIQQLFIAPTRELAQQIYDVIKTIHSDLSTVLVYGGHSIQTELNRLKGEPQIIIGTPGRIVDLIEREALQLSEVKHMVFDEFDKVLEMGFLNDIEKIVTSAASMETFFLASATELKILPEFLTKFKSETLDFRVDELAPQFKFFQVKYEEETKAKTLLELLCNIETDKTIVFCNHREKASELHAYLSDHDIQSCLYHGGLEQNERERALIKFKNGSSNHMICTDLGSRGIDIDLVKYIIHYQLPRLETEFTHRNGRSSRQNSEGVVFLFANQFIDWLAQIETSVFEIVENEPLPDLPNYKTMYISGGKRDKLNKVDIVGFLCKIGGLKSAEIGIIQVFDDYSLVAIQTDVFEDVLREVKEEKIKGKRWKIGFAQ